MDYCDLLDRGLLDPKGGLCVPNFPRLRRWKRSASRLVYLLGRDRISAKDRAKVADKAIDLFSAIAFHGGV